MSEQSRQARERAMARAGFGAVVDEERLARFLALPRGERIARALQRQINSAELSRWAARHPQEVPLINGELFFIAETLADNETPDGRAVRLLAAGEPDPGPEVDRGGAEAARSRRGGR